MDVERKQEFSLSIGYNDLDCDIEINRETGRVGAEIILQHHDKIITSGDIGIYISCLYNMNTSVVYQAMELGEELHNQGLSEELRLRSPDIRMRITDQQGRDITTARVGDPLAIRFEILDTDTPYDMFVRELVALDGTDSTNILLIDTLGRCRFLLISDLIFDIYHPWRLSWILQVVPPTPPSSPPFSPSPTTPRLSRLTLTPSSSQEAPWFSSAPW